MRNKRQQLEADIIRAARTFADKFDGFEHGLLSDQYIAWHNLSTALTEYDSLEPATVTGQGHTANADGPDTEHIAAALCWPAQLSIRRQIIFQLVLTERQGYTGLTCGELESDHRLRARHQTVSSALTWLRDSGWIQDSGSRRMSASKRPTIVWQLTAAGRDAAREAK